MSHSDVANICPRGRWMTEEDAISYLGITAATLKGYKQTPPMNMYFEKHKKAPAPYCYCHLVFISPEGSDPIFDEIKLLIWAKMCNYFSTTNIQSEDDVDELYSDHFVKYTGLKATPDNIDFAFAENVLKHSSKLNHVTPKSRGRPPSTNKKKVVKKKQSTKHNTATSDALSLVPQKEVLIKAVKERYEQIEQKDVADDDTLSTLGSMMKAGKWKSIAFKSRRKKSAQRRLVPFMFTVCECESNKITEIIGELSPYCRKCSARKAKQTLLDKRRQKHAAMRVAPDSKVAFKHLGQDERSIRVRSLKDERDRRAKAYKRLKAKFCASQIELKEMSEQMQEESRKALQYATDNPTELRSKMKTTLSDLIKEQNHSIEGRALSEDDIEPLTEMIVDEIKNQCEVMNDRKSQCKYSKKALAVAMSLYLRSGKRAYDQFRTDSIQVYPSVEYLAKLKQSQEITDGCCITQYEDQLLMRGQDTEEMGQLVMDEMKMTKDVVINTNNNNIYGVTNDYVSLKKQMISWLDNKSENLDDIEEYDEPATHVNHWMYRSTNGRTYNCEFWFNNGTLSGDALLEQFTRVVMNCETIGSRVLGLVCDAGGNNARLFSLLREGGQTFPTDAWVGEDAVRTLNPYDTSRYIHLFHCATHDLKGFRNAFQSSWVEGGVREFFSEDGYRIGKAVLDGCYERDRIRIGNGAKPMTRLNKRTVNLDKWTKMNVEEAKKCFEWNTLGEISDHLYKELGVTTNDGRLNVKDSSSGNKVGYMVEVAGELKGLLRKRIESKSLSSERADAIGNDVSSFEWLAHVHEIFHIRLMDMNFVVTDKNIDEYEEHVKKSLNYFHRLWSKQQERRKRGDANWKRTFLSSETWRIIRITCRGFFGYCRNCISYAANKKCIIFKGVSPAHANSSVIESWFSQVRGTRQDSSSAYIGAVKNYQMRDPNKMLKGNRMYSGKDVGNISVGEDVDARNFLKQQVRRNTKKDERLSTHEASRRKASIGGCHTYTINVETTSVPTSCDFELDVLNDLATRTLPRGYIEVLLKLDTFHQWIRLSFGNETEAWFEELLLTTDSAVGSASFDDACQTIMNNLLSVTADTMMARKSKTTSFEAAVHKFLKSKKFDNICRSELPGTLDKHRPGCVLLGLLLLELHKDWVTSALRSVRMKRNPGLLKKRQGCHLTFAQENNEVNSFLGWAIYSSLRKFADEEEDKNECKRLLLSMRILAEDIDEDYRTRYYDTNLCMLNCGGLTLVSKHFFNWGREVMQLVRYRVIF